MRKKNDQNLSKLKEHLANYLDNRHFNFSPIQIGWLSLLLPVLLFFCMGIISFSYSLFKCAEVEEKSITVYFGIFSDRKSFKIPWDEFDIVSLSSFEKSHMRTVGGRIRLPLKVTEKKEAILFKLKKPLLPQAKDEIINTYNKYFFLKKIAINSEGDEILLKTAPEGGFRRLLSEINKYFPVIIETDSEMFAFLRIHSLITIFNAVIILIVFFLGVMI